MPPLLKAARKLGIKTVVGVTSIPDPEMLPISRINGRKYRVDWEYFPPLFNLLVRLFLPNQIFNAKHGKTLFSPGWLTISLWFADMLSNNPWIQGGGFRTLYLIHQKATSKYLRSLVAQRENQSMLVTLN